MGRGDVWIKDKEEGGRKEILKGGREVKKREGAGKETWRKR